MLTAPAHHGSSWQDPLQFLHNPFKLGGRGPDAACQGNLTNAEQKGMRAFLSLLASLLLKQPSDSFAVTVLHCLILRLTSTVTPKSLSHLFAADLVALSRVINSIWVHPSSLLLQGLCQFGVRALCNLQETVSHYKFAQHSIEWGPISLLIFIITHKIERFYFLLLF